MAAALAASALLFTGLPQSQADVWKTDAAGADTVGAKSITTASYMPSVVQDSIHYTTIVPTPHVDPNALYGVDLPPNATTNNAYNVAAIDPATGKNTIQFAWRVATANVEQRNMAVDAGLGGGTEGFYSFYRGPYVNGVATPAGMMPVWFYAPGDTKASKMWHIPDGGYFGYSAASWTNGGAVVNQRTGMLYINTALVQFLGGTSNQEARFSIFDPKTSTTYWSGALQPATPAAKLWKGTVAVDPKGSSYGVGTGSLMPGIAILASGDFVILVKGTDTAIPATNPMNTTGTNIAAGDTTIGFLVRVHPTFNNTPWTYSLMKMITKAPSEPATRAFFQNNQSGLAFYNGKLIAETNAGELYSIDPMTGYWKYVSTIRNTNPIGPLAPSYAPQAPNGLFMSMTSTRTATSLTGHVYRSATATYDTSRPLPGITLALYEQNPAIGMNTPTLISTAVSNSVGQYTFLIPDVAADGSVTYFVRPIQSLIDGSPSLMVAGGVSTAPAYDIVANDGTLYCSDGTSYVSLNDGVMVSGPCPGPTTPPTLEPLGTTVDPTTFGAYGQITLRSEWDDPIIDFNLMATSDIPPVVDPAKSTIEIDTTEAVPVDDTHTVTVTLRSSDGSVLSSEPASSVELVLPANLTLDSAFSQNIDGSYSANVTSKIVGSYQVSATYNGDPVGAAAPDTVQANFKAGDPYNGPIDCPLPGMTGTNVTVDKSSVQVGGTSTVTALITDKYCNPVPDVPVTFTADKSGSYSESSAATYTKNTGTDGISTASLTDNVAETVTVSTSTPTIPAVYSVPDPLTVTFTAGNVVPGSSTLTIDNDTYVLVGTPTSDPVGGSHVITITLKDGQTPPNVVMVDHTSDIVLNLPAGVTATTPLAFNSTTGVYTATLMSTKAGSLPVTATYSGTAVGPTPGTTVYANYKAGAPDPGPFPCPDDPANPGVVTYGGSQLILGPSPVKIPATSTVQALVEDQFCNAIVSSTVTFSKDSSTATLTPSTAQTTGSNGKTPAVTVADTKAETVNLGATATDPADATAPAITVPYWVMNGSTPSTPTNTGPITFTAGDPAVTCDTGVTPCSNLTAQSPVDVNAQSTVTATITDAKGNLVPAGTPVTFSVPTTTTGMFIDPANSSNKVQTIIINTNALGVATVQLTDAHAQTVPVTATIAAGTVKPSPVNVVFQATDVDPSKSTFACSPTTALNDATYANYPVADGVAKYTCVVSLYDSAMDPLSGLASSVHVTDSSANVTITGDTSATPTSTPIDNGDGTYTVYLTTKVAQSTATASAVYNTSAIGTAQNTPFKPGPASNGPFDCNPGMTPGGLTVTPPVTTPLTGVPVDDTTTATATAKLTDKFCNPIPNTSVTITADGAAKLIYNGGTPAASITQNTGTDGTVHVVVNDSTAQTVNINATAPALVGVGIPPATTNPTGLLVGSPQQILFTSEIPAVTCDAGIPASACTNLSVTPAPVDAATPGTAVSVDDPAGSATATVLVTDKHGNKLANQTVTFASTGSATFVSATGTHAATTTAVTDSNGLATVWVVDDKAEKVDISAKVGTPALVVPGAVPPPSPTPLPSTSQPLQFKPGEPIVGPCTPTAGAAPQTGTKLTADPYDNGTTLANVPVKTGSSTVTALVMDDKCNPVPDVVVTFGNDGNSVLTPATNAPLGAKTATTGTDGKATATLTDDKAETVTLTATIPVTGNPAASITGVPSPLKVTFAAGEPAVTCDAGVLVCSNLKVDPPAVNSTTPGTAVSVDAAPGSAKAIATVTDKSGNLLKNQTVTFSSTGSATFLTPGTTTATTTAVTNDSGVATVWVIDDKAEQVTITATVGAPAQAIHDPQPLLFKPGEPIVGPCTPTAGAAPQTGTKLTADPYDNGATLANVQVTTGSSTVTALVMDDKCNPVPDVVVTFGNTGSSILTPASNDPLDLTVKTATTGTDGKATATLTDSKAETVTLTATIPVTGNPTASITGVPSPLKVTFAAGGPSNTCITTGVCTNLVVTPTPVNSTMPGTGVSVDAAPGGATATATITDASGNLLANQTVTFTSTGDATFVTATGAHTPTTTATTGTDGKATVWVVDKTAEQVGISASVTGINAITGSPQPILFIPGEPTVGPFDCKTGQEGTNMQASPYDAPGAPANVTVSSGSSVVTLLVTDKYCNPVQGVTVTAHNTSPSGNSSLTPATNWVTNSNGRVTAFLTDLTAETVTLSATIPVSGNPTAEVPVLPAKPLTVTFKAGGPSNTCTAGTVCTNLAVIPAVTNPLTGVSVEATPGTAKAIATITDAYGNVLVGQVVTFTSDSGTAKFLNPANGAVTTTATTDSTGKATVWVTDIKAEEVKVSAGTTGLTPIAGSPKSILFIPGDPSVGPFPDCTDGRPGTNLTASPYDKPGVPANVSVSGGNSTVAVLVTDKYCNPIPGVPVTVNKTGAAVLTPASPIDTNDQGIATTLLTDSTAQTVTLTATIPTKISLTDPVVALPSAPLTVTFLAGGPANTCNNGGVCSYLAVTPTPATPLTPVLVTAPAGAATAKATIKDAEGNLLKNIPVTFSAGASSTARFVNPANGAYVTTLPTGDDGTVTVYVVDPKAETVQVSAGTANISAITYSPLPILFAAGPPSNTCTTAGIVCTNLTVIPTPATPLTGVSVDTLPGAAGSASATATITDANGNLLSGVQVTFTSGTSTTAKFLDPADGHQVTSMTTGANGQATVWVFDPKAETVQVSANTATIPAITGSPQPIKFVPGQPDVGPTFPKCQTGEHGTNLSANPSDSATGPANVAVSTGSSIVTALVTDQYCNPIPGVQVTFNNDGKAVLTLGSTNGVTDADGKATATLTDKTAETVALSATINAKGNPVAPLVKNPDPLTVTFAAGAPSNTCVAGATVCTNLKVTPTPVNSTTPGTGVSVDAAPGAATATATITDAQGNLLANIDVTFSSTGDATFVDTTAAHNPITGSVKTNAQGQVTVDVIDNTAETVQISAATSGIPAITGSPQPIQFIPGDPSVGPFTCKTGQQHTNLSANPYDAPGAPANVSVNGGNSLVTALVTDDKCNPVSGVQVTFNKTGNAVLTLGASNGVTGSDGKATASLMDSTAQTVTLTATIPIPGNSAAVMPTNPSPLTVTFVAGGPANICTSGTVCTNLVVTPTPVNSTTPGTGVSVDAAPGLATATATITDEKGNLLGGQTVTFTSTGDATFVTATGAHTPTTTATTDPITGKATVWVVDNTAETVFISAGVATINAITGSPQPIKFIPGDPSVGPFPLCKDGQVGTNLSANPSDVQSPTFVPANVSVNGGSSTVTALVTDDKCNPVPGVTVTFTKTGSSSLVLVSGGVTGNDGKATAILTDKVAEKVTLTASIPQGNIVTNPAPLTVTFQAGVPTNYCATGAPVCTNLAVTPAVTTPLTGVKVTDPNGSATATATITDAQGNLLPGIDVIFTQTGNAQFLDPATGLPVNKMTTGANGKATVWVVDKVAQQVGVTATTDATGNINGSPKPILFVAGAPSNGPFNCADSATKGTHLSVTPPVTSPLTGVKVDAPAGSATATMLVTDVECNPIEGARVTFASDSTTARFTNPTTNQVVTDTVLTGPDGTVTLNVIDTKAEVVTVSATDDVASPPVPGSPKQIQFIAGDPIVGPEFPECTPAQIAAKQFTHLEANPFDDATPANVSVDGGKSIVTALVTDKYCNPAPNVVVTFGKTGSAVFSTSATPPVITNTATTNANGIATLNLTDTKAETVTLTSTIPVTGNPTAPMLTFPSPLKVTFAAGTPAKTCDTTAVVCSNLQVTPTPASFTTPGTDVSVDDAAGAAKATATVTDKSGNLLKDVVVTFTSNKATTKFVDPKDGTTVVTTMKTDGKGQAIVWVVDSTAQVDNISAAINGTDALFGMVGTQRSTTQTWLPIKFVAGPPIVGPFDCTPEQMANHEYTHLEADPFDGTTPANVLTITGTSTVTALVTDDKCNPVEGVTVTINKTGSATLTPSAPQKTGSDGKVVVTLKDNTAETVTLTSTIPPDATHPTAQQMITIPSPLKVTFTNVVDCSDTTKYPDGCASIIDYSLSQFEVMPPKPNMANQSTWRLADGLQSYTGTLTAKDKDGHLLDGLSLAPDFMKFAVATTAQPCTFAAATNTVTCQPVTVTQSSITRGPAKSGQYSVTYKSTVARSDYTASVWINDAWTQIGAVQNIPFRNWVDCSTLPPNDPTCNPDPTKTTFSVTPVAKLSDQSTWVVADGSAAYTAKMTAVNKDGIFLDGLDTTKLAVTASAGVNVSGVTKVGNGTGEYTVKLTSTKALSTYVASMKYNGTIVYPANSSVATLPVPFKPGPPDPYDQNKPKCEDGRSHTQMWISPTSLQVGQTAVATALVTDKNCNPIQGISVTFAQNGAATLAAPTGVTNANGLYATNVTDATPQTVTVTFTFIDPAKKSSATGGSAIVTFNAVPVVVQTDGSIAASAPYGAFAGVSLAIVAGLWLAIRRRFPVILPSSLSS